MATGSQAAVSRAAGDVSLRVTHGGSCGDSRQQLRQWMSVSANPFTEALGVIITIIISHNYRLCIWDPVGKPDILRI